MAEAARSHVDWSRSFIMESLNVVILVGVLKGLKTSHVYKRALRQRSRVWRNLERSNGARTV